MSAQTKREQDTDQDLSGDRDVAVSKRPSCTKAHDPGCSYTTADHQIVTWHVARHVLGYSAAPCLRGEHQ